LKHEENIAAREWSLSYVARSHSPKSFACDNRVYELSFARYAASANRVLTNFHRHARGTRVKNNKTCTRDYEVFVHVKLSTALATFRASGGSHGVTECILTWIYCRSRKYTACHSGGTSQSRKNLCTRVKWSPIYPIPLPF